MALRATLQRGCARLLPVAVAAVMLLPSCGSDDETESNDYCYISGFTLESLKRAVFVTSSEGTDSVYYTSFSGSLFPMTIDQRKLTIENNDSLPQHTRVSAVLATVTWEGVLAWRKVSDTTGNWTSYSSTDSLNFTEPLHFACFASDGTSYRQYTVKMNVHQQKGDSTVWNEVRDVSALSRMGERKALCLGGQMAMLGEDGSRGLTCVKHPMETSGDWTEYSTTGTEGADIASLQQRDDTLFLSTANGQLLRSENAVDWTDAGFPRREGLRLVGASQRRLYALADGKLLSSDGGDWTEESLDDSENQLPTRQVRCLTYQMADGQDRLLMVGEGQEYDEDYCKVWAKAWRDEGETETTWMFYTPNGTDKYRCPVMECLCVEAYDDGFIAFGGRSCNGNREPMENILYSPDHGVTWKPYDNDDMEVDPLIQDAALYATHIASAVDEESYLWIVVDNKVWRGRINRLGFLRQDP